MRSRTPLADQLVAAGRVALLETRGRVTGAPLVTPVGFVAEPDGYLLVAASSATTHWARNLLADPHCRVTIGGRTFPAVAEELEREGATKAVRELILKYGTPSESLGAGPAFRLRLTR